MEELAVHLRDRRVGTLRSDGGALSFAYAADYLREPGAEPAIYSATLEGTKVEFRTQNAGGNAKALVAAYQADGRLLTVVEPKEQGGIYTAAVPAACASCKIFLLDGRDTQPMCKAVSLTK